LTAFPTVIAQRDIYWLKNALDSDALVMRPPYQRNPVWTTKQKAALIDTILNGYPIPELYMQDVTSEGRAEHIVVDGQQRVRACLEFVDGLFSLDETISASWGELTFEELGDEDQRVVLNYPLVFRILPQLPEEEIRAIFKRLNQNVVALNRQELRHATYWGPFIKLMESLSSSEFWTQSGIFSPNDYRRMLDTEFVSELTVAVLNGPQNKKAALDAWYEIYEAEFDEEDLITDVFRTVTGELGQAFPELRRTRWRNKSDFYTLFLTLAEHRYQLPLAAERRELLRTHLVEFGQAVNSFVSRNRDPGEVFDDDVSAYGGAVQRAGSDVQSRVERQQALDRVLAGVFEA
jgi:hypothetical protein